MTSSQLTQRVLRISSQVYLTHAPQGHLEHPPFPFPSPPTAKPATLARASRGHKFGLATSSSIVESHVHRDVSLAARDAKFTENGARARVMHASRTRGCRRGSGRAEERACTSPTSARRPRSSRDLLAQPVTRTNERTHARMHEHDTRDTYERGGLRNDAIASGGARCNATQRNATQRNDDAERRIAPRIPVTAALAFLDLNTSPSRHS